jgi:hypothetical protein
MFKDMKLKAISQVSLLLHELLRQINQRQESEMLLSLQQQPSILNWKKGL